MVDSQVYGCTAVPGSEAHPYPFDSSTVTLNMENDVRIVADASGSLRYVQLGYLHNVVPSETNPQNHNALSVKSQAIAARTYAYFEMTYPTCADGQEEITNSNSDQVYLPYMYEQQPESSRETIDQAVAERYYMSYAQSIQACGTTIGTDQPIFSEFSADAYERTIDHPEMGTKYPYLKGVADPISNHPDIQYIVDTTNAHERGYSQNGASRWANGNRTSDPNGDLGAWPVQWTTPAQILTHYYTGIHIRDANSGNAILTPTRRWVPLRIAQLNTPTDTIRLCDNGPTTLIVTVQNTGVYNWGPEAFDLSYQPAWSTETLPRELPDNINYVPATDAGDSATTAVTIMVPDNAEKGSAIIRLDMRAYNADGSDYEWFSEGGWPGYAINAEVVECGNNIELGVFLPIVTLGGPVVQ
ncbi:MAG: hypothetical protein H6642_02560 [Caldilineaceae bacterium]|nr:hypothetical protein [Caldilineaceae bacterium]